MCNSSCYCLCVQFRDHAAMIGLILIVFNVYKMTRVVDSVQDPCYFQVSSRCIMYTVFAKIDTSRF